MVIALSYYVSHTHYCQNVYKMPYFSWNYPSILECWLLQIYLSVSMNDIFADAMFHTCQNAFRSREPISA